MKILTVVGARPQFIKVAPVSLAIAAVPGVSEVLVHTGQHFDANMSDVFFDELGIAAPRYNLGIGGGTHGQNTGRMIEGLERLMIEEKPDWVLVYGDTDSTLAGALAAVKLHVRVAHVEAGLRSYNMVMPEEVNRRVTDHVSTLLFTPSAHASTILRGEGIADDRVLNVGDVMYDAARLFGGRATQRSELLARFGVTAGDYVLATIHRQENTDDPVRLAAIFDALGRSGRPIVLPLHPRTRNSLARAAITPAANIVVTEPLGYLDMNALESAAALIATDSGGVQKEAYFHRVPCITLRDETEWVELIDLGWNRLARPGADDLAAILQSSPARGRDDVMPYGDGAAAVKIVDALVERTR
ncbi:UDP-N-acetylglucosamine 2-epimerase (non-hydrolyzing) [Sphingomonas sp. LR60]|uniref:non-hydrolyzing UDP-N-acetylglucosamine 2-epimerase n=1 Tax=Sphingomonas sp. LR60 TaxID=3050233 RepID=UPI002FDF6CC6